MRINQLFILVITFTIMTAGHTDDSELLKSNLLTFAFDRFDPPIPGKPELDDERRSIIKRFGYPEQIETVIKPDRGEPGYDVEMALWRYEGLTIALSTSLISMHTRSKISSITLTSAKHELQLGLNIGRNKLEYQKYLGTPKILESGTYIYEAGRYTNVNGIDFYSGQDVTIEFDDQGNSTSITWAYSGH